MTARAVVREALADGAVEVEIAAARPCRGCEGACLWRRLPQAARATLPADGTFAAGDEVLVCLPERHVLAGAAVLHGLPWAALVGGALAGYAVSGTDLGSLIGALGGVAVSLSAAARLRGRLERWLLGQVLIAPVRP